MLNTAAIISDVHGNYPALCAVLSDIALRDIDEIYCLGDLCGYYSMINEVISLIKERGIINLMGNHDYYIAYDQKCPRSSSANFCLEYQRRVISSENLKFIKECPMVYSTPIVSMVHGGWIDNLDEYLYDVKETYFAARPGRFFFSGHTHIQTFVKFNDIVYCNPGSVGQPRDGDNRAAYATIDLKHGVVSLRRVEYDIDCIASDMKMKGFSAHYYSNLYMGKKIGENS